MKLFLLPEAGSQTPNRIVPSLRDRNCLLAVFLFDKATTPIFSETPSAHLHLQHAGDVLSFCSSQTTRMLLPK